MKNKIKKLENIEKENKKEVKKANSEFDFINLPHNRKELFFDVLKQRFRTLYFLGLIFFLTLLPLIIVLALKDNAMINAYNDPSLKTEEAKNFAMFNVSFIFYPFMLVGLMIVPIFLGGILKNIRNLAWEDPIFLKDDFSKGLTSTIKVNLLSGFIFSTFLIATSIAISYPGLVGIIRGILIAILFLIIVPIHLLVLYQSNIYQNRYRDYLYNSLLIYVRFFFYMLLIGVIYFIPIVFYLFIPNIILKYSIIVVYVLALFPMVMLLTQIIFNYIFDKGINEKHYPEIVNKGIYILENNKTPEKDKVIENKDNKPKELDNEPKEEKK